MRQAHPEAHGGEKKPYIIQHAQWYSVLAEGRDLDMKYGG